MVLEITNFNQNHLNDKSHDTRNGGFQLLGYEHGKLGFDISDSHRDRCGCLEFPKKEMSSSQCTSQEKKYMITLKPNKMKENDEMTEQCVDMCSECAEECTSCATECKDKPGMEICIRLCNECADACTQCAEDCESNSKNKAQSIQACIKACEACADECEKHEHASCINCARVCRACVEECNKMIV